MLESRNIVAILLGGNLKETHNKRFWQRSVSLLLLRSWVVEKPVQGTFGVCYANIIIVIGNGKFLLTTLKVLKTAAGY